MNAKEVIEFQDRVLMRFVANSKAADALKQNMWMGFGGRGVTLAEMPEQDADHLIQLIGPVSLKVMRLSPNILQVIRDAQARGQPIVASGGACQIITADNKELRKATMDPNVVTQLVRSLPSMIQVADASAPIACADIFVDIVEDSLFAEFAEDYTQNRGDRMRFLPEFTAAGERHIHLFDAWQKTVLGAGAHGTEIRGAFFSKLPMQDATLAHCRSEAFKPHLAGVGMSPETAAAMGRSQVEFSFTGAWTDMLREINVIPRDSCYLVVEPFHHFTETHNPNGKVGTPLFRSNLAIDRFFRANPYGKPGSANAGVAGGIAFYPCVAGEGTLAHATVTADKAHRLENTERLFAERRARLTADKVPELWNDKVFIDALNYAYTDAECRRAMADLTDLWFSIIGDARATANGNGNGEAKELRKLARKDPVNIQKARAARELLILKIEEVMMNVLLS